VDRNAIVNQKPLGSAFSNLILIHNLPLCICVGRAVFLLYFYSMSLRDGPTSKILFNSLRILCSFVSLRSFYTARTMCKFYRIRTLCLSGATILFGLAVTRWLRSTSYSMPGPVNTWMGDCLWAGTPFWYVISQLGQLSLPSLRGRLIEYQPFWLGLGGARSLVSGGRWHCWSSMAGDVIGVEAQSTLGGAQFLPEKYVLEISKMPEFYIGKWSKYQNFFDMCPKNLQNSRILHDFCPKNARILHNNCPKNIFPEF